MKTSWLRCLHPLVNLVFLLRLTRVASEGQRGDDEDLSYLEALHFDECPGKDTPRTSRKQGPVIQNYDCNMTYKHI